MKRYRVWLFVVSICMIVAGCGGTSGQSTGSFCAQVKGLEICLTSARPEYLGTADAPNYTSNVDAFQVPDCDDDPETVTPEPFADHGVVVNINIRPLNPYIDVFPQTGVIFESYTIDYRPSIDSIGAPPIERYQAYNSWISPAPTSDNPLVEQSRRLVLIDLPRKSLYRDNLLSGRYSSINNTNINNYTATITIYGRTDRGDRFSISNNVAISIGPYNNCPE